MQKNDTIFPLFENYRYLSILSIRFGVVAVRAGAASRYGSGSTERCGFVRLHLRLRNTAQYICAKSRKINLIRPYSITNFISIQQNQKWTPKTCGALLRGHIFQKFNVGYRISLKFLVRYRNA
jgi:hypothetical protein